jgi:hypothetical protein
MGPTSPTDIHAGKQARANNQGDVTTHVSPVNAQQLPAKTHNNAAASQNQSANSDPNAMNHQAYQQPHGDAYLAADAGQNRAAQAGNTAAHVVGNNQKISGAVKGKKVDHEELARMLAEENETKGRLPKYPGLERWKLVEKMGDGAFSNVYRAIDTTGKAGEVAIKVVRKFEMNSQQVSCRI